MRAILILALALPHYGQAVEVTNFRSGLACTNTSPEEGRSGWICHPTEEVLVTDQGHCTYNGEDRLCTWMGFEFDYANAAEGTELACHASQSMPGDFGNPEERQLKDATEQAFSLPLPAGDGHFFNPQYFVFAVRDPETALMEVRGHCAHAGVELFQWTYLVRFPQLPSAQPTPNNSVKGMQPRGTR